MLLGKICVIVGGAGEKGSEVIKGYARNHYKIAFMDIDKEAGSRLKNKLEKEYGTKVFFFHGDAKSEEDLELFAGAVIGQYQKIDCLYYYNHITGSRGEIVNLLRHNLKKGSVVRCI